MSMSGDEFLNSQAREALRLRARGHTYNYIAEKLNMTPEQAQNVVQEEMKTTKVMETGDDETGVTEITIRLHHMLDTDGRVASYIRRLAEMLYQTEQEWEESFIAEENAGKPVLDRATTFSVSRVIVDNAPQTGKSVIFPEV